MKLKKLLAGIATMGVLALGATTASADLKVIAGSTSIQSPEGADATITVPVYIEESGSSLDEKLATWQLVMTLQGANIGSGGVNLGTPAAPTTHAYVYGAPTANFSDLGSDLTSVAFMDFLPGSAAAVNIVNGMGLLEIPVTIPAGTLPGTYTLSFDAENSLLASEDEATFPGGLIPATYVDATITVTAVPEPAGLGLMGVVAMGLLRRRRSA